MRRKTIENSIENWKRKKSEVEAKIKKVHSRREKTHNVLSTRGKEHAHHHKLVSKSKKHLIDLGKYEKEELKKHHSKLEYINKKILEHQEEERTYKNIKIAMGVTFGIIIIFILSMGTNYLDENILLVPEIVELAPTNSSEEIPFIQSVSENPKFSFRNSLERIFSSKVSITAAVPVNTLGGHCNLDSSCNAECGGPPAYRHSGDNGCYSDSSCFSSCGGGCSREFGCDTECSPSDGYSPDGGSSCFSEDTCTNSCGGGGGGGGNACQTLSTANEFFRLNASVSGPGNCFSIGANHITIFCQNKSGQVNITYGNGGSTSYGVDNSGGMKNLTVQNCNFIEGSNMGNAKHGILVSGGKRNLIFNNSFTTKGSGSNSIHLKSFSDSTTIKNNVINVTGSNGAGIAIIGTKATNITSNNITVRGGGGDGISISDTSSGNILLNNNLSVTSGLYINDTTSTSQLNFLIYNNSFGDLKWYDNGTNSFPRNLTLNLTNNQWFGNIGNLKIASNVAALNSSAFDPKYGGRRINVTGANVTLKQLALSSIDKIFKLAAYNTNANQIQTLGSNCNGTTCHELSYNTGTLIFNTSTFSSFSATAPNPVGNICQTISTGGVFKLNASVTSTTTCFTVSANHVRIFCQNKSGKVNITYGTSGSSGNAITNSGSNNVSVQNCNIIEGSSSGSSKDAISFTGASNGLIKNNSFTLSGSSSSAIFFQSGSNSNTFEKNVINSTSFGGFGINIQNSNANNISSNNITVSGFLGTGINLIGTSTNNVFLNNNLSVKNGHYILDSTSTSFVNYIIYNNTQGEIKWRDNGTTSFPRNLTLNLSNNQGFGHSGNLHIGADVIALNTSAFNLGKGRINKTGANLTLKGLGFSSINQILKFHSFSISNSTIQGSGTNCNGTSCHDISFSGGTLLFNTTSFSSFSATGNAGGNNPPSAPILITPNNNTVTNNRTPAFRWNTSTDTENASVNYHFQIDDSLAFNNPEVNTSNILNESAGNSTHKISTELAVDTLFYWRVRSFDGTDFSAYSKVRNFTVQSLLSITLRNSSVQFGVLALDQRENTTDENPRPLYAENTGNINFNVSLNGTRYFTDIVYENKSNYMFKIRVNETGSFDTSQSQMAYINMTLRNKTLNVHVVNVSWQDINDDFKVDLNITVPKDEPPGYKHSNITFFIEG